MVPPVYKTNRYLIRPYRQEDERRFLEMVMDDEIIKFMGGATGNEAEEKETFNKIFEIYESNEKRWFWIWGIYEADRLCAHIELKETKHSDIDELEIVYMVHPEERRKGLMAEVLETLKENQHLWRKKIIATVAPENIHSIALLKRWGIEKSEVITDMETGKNYYKFSLAITAPD